MALTIPPKLTETARNFVEDCQSGGMAASKKERVAEVLKRIRATRGILKRKQGEKSFVEQMADYKRSENELEEAKLARLTGAGLLPVEKKINRLK